MMENSKTMKSKGLEPMNGLTNESTRACGTRTKCTVKAFINGQMVGNLEAIIKTIKSMAKVLLLGKMDENTKDFGMKVIRMEKEFSKLSKEIFMTWSMIKET